VKESELLISLEVIDVGPFNENPIFLDDSNIEDMRDYYSTMIDDFKCEIQIEDHG
jgi:hypothetical protein